MQVIRNIADFPDLDKVVVTNGTFDGCHLGHQKIIKQLIRSAKSIGGKSVILTYWPHPRIVLGKESDDFKLLYTIEERIEMLSQFEIDYLVILEFTKEFASQSSSDFIQNILVSGLNTSKLIIGYNHRFGKNREGGFDYLKENCHKYGFEVEEISKQVIDDEGISSTKIRKALTDGDIHIANQYLVSEFMIKGTVVRGKQLGRTLGYPTANLALDSQIKITPKEGVYAVKVKLKGKIYNGMLNIGFKPTVDGKNQTIEVHLFNFKEEIYGESIQVFFIQRLRDEQKFENLQALQQQLKIDEESARKRLTS